MNEFNHIYKSINVLHIQIFWNLGYFKALSLKQRMMLFLFTIYTTRLAWNLPVLSLFIFRPCFTMFVRAGLSVARRFHGQSFQGFCFFYFIIHQLALVHVHIQSLYIYFLARDRILRQEVHCNCHHNVSCSTAIWKLKTKFLKGTWVFVRFLNLETCLETHFAKIAKLKCFIFNFQIQIAGI